MGDLGDINDGPGGADAVDLAMKGWEELGSSPEKMQELMKSFKDPEILAQAQEMLKDPQYMAAAKAKVAQIQAKAQANGLLDANGQPVPGAASAGLDNMMKMMGGANAAGSGAPGVGEARDWELDNIQRHKDGDMNTAELGMANLKAAMNDPSVLGEVAQMMKDPENVAALKKMMADPAFHAQAKQMQQQMKASGDMPDFSQLQQMMGAGMGAGGGGAGGGAAAELERLRRENAQLKAQLR
jgi:hypothetical protein